MLENLWPSVDKLIAMMDYLGIEAYTVPHFNLKMLKEADGENYRAEKIFKFHNNGTISYYGWSPTAIKENIKIEGITPTDQYINRIYIYMVDDVKAKIIRKTERCKMNYVRDLILKFNSLDFIEFGKGK